MKTEHLTKKQKQRKFIITLIILGSLAGLIFTVWYLWQKNILSISQLTGGQPVENRSTNDKASTKVEVPGDTLENMADLNVFNTRFIFTQNYDDFSVGNGFEFIHNLEGKYDKLPADQAKIFWQDFEGNYGKPDLDTAKFEARGNGVIINFKTLEKNLNFRRVISYAKLGEDFVVSGDLLEQLPLAIEAEKLKVGDSFPANISLETFIDGKNVAINPLGDAAGQRILLSYCPSAFREECNQEGKDLMQSQDFFKQNNIQVFFVTADLPSIQQAWLESYFGKSPYILASDVQRQLRPLLGINNETLEASFIMVIDDKGKIISISEAGKHFKDIRL